MGIAQTLDSVSTGPIRNLFAEAGLLYPAQRALVIGALWGLHLFLTRPSRSFDEYGDPLPWTLYNPEVEVTRGRRVKLPATHLPWWLETTVVTIAAGLFI